MNNRPLQSKDLMLGDWVMWGYTTASGVKVGGYKMQVAAVYQDDLVDLIDSDSLYEQVPMDEVEAIPLTEAILDKNCADVRKGDDNRSWQWTWENPTGYVEISTWADGDHISDGFFMSCNGSEYAIMVLHYVHELQHALRLAGIGKEIEL